VQACKPASLSHSSALSLAASISACAFLLLALQLARSRRFGNVALGNTLRSTSSSLEGLEPCVYSGTPLCSSVFLLWGPRLLLPLPAWCRVFLLSPLVSLQSPVWRRFALSSFP
jgi:hypothetical protein